MTDSNGTPSPVVVVAGANGLVGAQVCTALVERGATVRAVVRRPGSAPELSGVAEHVGEFHEPAFAADVVEGADAVVTTVHPMGSDRETQHAIGVEGTMVMARAARDAGVGRLVHVSTAAVYDRRPQAGDVVEASDLVGEDANAYAATKRDADLALAQLDGITRVIVRPPAIIGAGDTSIWNSIRPDQMRVNEDARKANPEQSWPWVHVTDLAELIADVASGRIEAADDPSRGPIEGGCTPVNVAGEEAILRDYFGTVTGALGVEPVWDDSPAWKGQYRAERAHAWGWKPRVGLAEALAEIDGGLRSRG